MTSASHASASSSLSAGNSTLLNSEKDTSTSGLSTGAAVGIAIGVILGVITLIAAAVYLYRRKKKNEAGKRSRYSGVAGAMSSGINKETYRDMSGGVPIRGASGGEDAGSAPYFQPYDGYPPASSGVAGSDWNEKPYPAYPEYEQNSPYASSNTILADPQHATFGTADYPFVGGYEDAGRTRELTNVATYGGPSGGSPYPYSPGGPVSPYQDRDQQYSPYLPDGRDSPTDYYGHALTPADHLAVAEQYGDFPISEDGQSMRQYGIAAAGPAGFVTQEQGRIPINVEAYTSGTKSVATPQIARENDMLPQLPTLSPDLFGSSLDNSFASVQYDGRSQTAPAQRSEYMTSQEKLKNSYADLARAAQVDEPITPTTAGLLANPSYPVEPSAGLTPPAAHQRYQHGQPLSPLEEVETPAPTTGGQTENPFDDRSTTGFDPSGASTDSIPLPHQPVTPAPQYSDAVMAESPVLVRPSPEATLPESPASCNGPSTPQRNLDVPLVGKASGSAVSLDAIFMNTPESLRRKSLAPNAPASNRLSTATTATNVEDAYEGI